MINKLKGLLFTDTGKDTAIVFIGTFVNVVLGGLFFILAPRILGPESYGLFSVVMATGLMAVNFANFGIDTGILRFLKHGDEKTNQKILKLAFKTYLYIGFLIFILGFLFSTNLAQFLGVPMIANLLKIAFAGVIFILISNFFIATLQSRKQFFKASLVNISSNTARLFLLLIVSYFFTINLYYLTIIFFFVVLISVIVGKIFVPLNFLKAKGEYIHFKIFFGYNFWIAAAMAISAIPFDNYLLTKFAGPISTGLYFAPYKILNIVDQLAGNFSRVLAPRLTSFDSDLKATNFIKKVSPVVLIICIGILIVSFFADPIIGLLWGNQYLGSVIIFRILAIGYAFYFANTPAVSIIVYYFGQSKAAFIISLILTLFWFLLNLLLIPQYKEVGAAIAFLIDGFASFILFTAYVLWKFSAKNNNDQD